MLPKVLRASDGTAGMADGLSDQVFIIAEGDVLQLPEDFDPAAASYVRAGPDLMLTGADGSEIVIADFFMSETPSALVGGDGSRISGALAARLAGPSAPSQEAGEAVPSAAIGRVSALTGDVTVIRADGTTITLHAGDSVFVGDILNTGMEAGVGLLLVDGTAVSMAAEGRMVLDDLVYDPDMPGGSLSLSVLTGVFTIVSGEISKTTPDAMQIHTPTAILGIHGAQVGLDLNGDHGLTVVMMEEADGWIGEISVTNESGVITLDQAYFALTVDTFNMAPTPVQTFAHDMLLQTFGVTFAFLPVEGTNANDYGLQASIAEGLAGFQTLAGTDEAAFDTSAGGAPQTDVLNTDVLTSAAGDTIPSAEGIAGFDALAADALPVIDTPSADVATLTTDAGGVAVPTASVPADVVFGAEIAPAAVMENIAAVALGEINVMPPSSSAAPSSTPPAPPPSPSALPDASATAPPVNAPPVNAPPVAHPGTVLTAEDNIFSGRLSATDREGDVLTFDVAEGGDPANGAVAISSDGTFSYTPDSDFGGEDTFTYQVTDAAGGVSTATVSVTVTQMVDVPVLAVSSAVGSTDTGVTLAIAAAMPAGTHETISTITLSGVPSGATLNAGTDNGDGSWDLVPDQLSGLVLTPPEDYRGAFDLRVTAVSSDGGIATEDFSVPVVADVSAPTLTVSDVDVQETVDFEAAVENTDHEAVPVGDQGADETEETGAAANNDDDGEAGDVVSDAGDIDDGTGNEDQAGGEGEDAFVIRAGDGTDIILDLGEHDELRFEGPEFSAEDFTLQADGDAGTTITFGADAGVSVTLNDVPMDANGDGYSVTQDGNAVVVAFHATDSGD